jgi:methylamine dehydrogenase accessory protein MauD
MQSLNAALPYIVLLQLALTLALAVLLFGLARQIGVLHERIAPMGAMTSDRGPQVGEPAPALSAPTLEGEPLELGGSSADGRSRLLLFVAPSCPVCKKLLPIAQSFMRAERVRITLVGDGEPAAQRAMVQQFGLEGLAYVSSPQIGLTYQVGKLPYAVLIDAAGVIRAKGLVNTREHLESLLIAEETGFGTVQAYLSAGARAQPARTDAAEVSET